MWAQEAIETWVGYGVDWSSTAAWVQAVFSVLAIAASTAVAVWVPLRMREIEQRDAAFRALRNAAAAGSSVSGTWLSLKEIKEKGAMNGATAPILQSQIAGARSMLAEVPRHMLGPDALLAVGVFEMQAAAFDTFITAYASACAQGHGEEPFFALPFEEIAAEIDKRTDELSRMDAFRVGGLWHIDHRDSDWAKELRATVKARR